MARPSDESLRVWWADRTLPFAADGGAPFRLLLEAADSEVDLERRWGVEGLYRNASALDLEQVAMMLDVLLRHLDDPYDKCAEHALKGLQYNLESLSAEQGKELVERLAACTTLRRARPTRMLVIEVTATIIQQFAHDSRVAVPAIRLLSVLAGEDPLWTAASSPHTLARLEPWGEMFSLGLKLKPIGVVRNGFRDEKSLEDFCSSSPSLVILNEDLAAETLVGLDAYPHILVYCYLDVIAPHAKEARSRAGVFGGTQPVRPVPIFAKFARLLEVQGREIAVAGLRAFDLTPVLDLQPYKIEKFNGGIP